MYIIMYNKIKVYQRIDSYYQRFLEYLKYIYILHKINLEWSFRTINLASHHTFSVTRRKSLLKFEWYNLLSKTNPFDYMSSLRRKPLIPICAMVHRNIAT